MDTGHVTTKLTIAVVVVIFFLSLFSISALPAPVGTDEILARMTLKEKVGQLLMVNVLENPDGSPSVNMKKLIQKYNIGSVILYNVADPRAAARYTNQLQKWTEGSTSRLPLLVGSDLEYGLRTNVLNGVTTLPLQMGIGATGAPELARRAATITAREARSIGIHWNFAPVADVNSNPENPVIGVRSFGSNPEEVSFFVKEAVKGYQENDVIATLKHYPGHGDTDTDSHYGLPKVSYGEDELESHLRPFAAGIEAGADAIMTAHIIVESLDPSLPATMSKKIVKGLLRKRQGFDGVVITDAMNMGAIEENFGKVEGAVKSIKAGVDVVMTIGDYRDAEKIYRGVLEAVKEGEIPISTVDRSVKRILGLKKEYGLLEGDNLTVPAGAAFTTGSPGNRKVARSIANRALTLVRDSKGLVPIRGKSDLLLVGVKDSVRRLGDELERLDPILSLSVYRTPSSRSANGWSPSTSEIDKAVKMASGFETVVVCTFSGGRLPKGQERLVHGLVQANENTIVIAEGLPYDLEKFPGVPAYMATYAYNRWNAPRGGNSPMTKATAKALLGRIESEGELPVSLEIS